MPLHRRTLLLATPALIRPTRAATPPLAPFHAALAALRAGRRPRVDVLQLGDSHTANDTFSARLRDLFQSRYGNAGRGLLPPAVPHPWYRPAQLTVAAEGWRPIPAAPTGLPALRQHADGPATLTLSTETPGTFAHLALHILPQPGTVTARPDTDPLQTLPTTTPWLTFTAPTARTVTLTTSGPLDLLGTLCLNGQPGLTWSNLGTPGATIAVTTRWTPALVTEELRHLDPALILLAFGTNEAFKDTTDPVEYRTLFTNRLQALRALAPAAALLVLLPPDAARRQPGVEPRSTPDTAPAARQCEPGISIPPMLPVIRRIQSEAAAAQGAATWDWSAATGGPCSILPLTRTNPPAAAPDLVHFFAPGYRMAADSLFAFLTRAP